MNHHLLVALAQARTADLHHRIAQRPPAETRTPAETHTHSRPRVREIPRPASSATHDPRVW